MEREPRAAALTVVLVLLLIGAVSAAGVRAGDAAGPAEPSVVQPLPLPGEVVPAGRVAVGARLHSSAGVAEAEVLVDGERVAHELHGAGGTHRDLRATAGLAAGHHRIEVRFVDVDGRTAGRSWWIGASDLAIGRLAGPDRIATAVAVSRRQHTDDGGVGAAVLARADDFADALAGATLASQVAGPLLLSGRDALPAATAQELRRVVAPGGAVHLLGGGAALSHVVAEQVRALGLVPQRLAGDDRHATAAAVAELIPESATAIVASGWSFPDALAASSPAARDGLPILLTAPDRLPAPVRDLLTARDFDRVHVIGGPAVVSDAVVGEIATLAGSVARVAGPTRYETTAAVTDAFFGSIDTVVVASGQTFPDALTGGPYAAALGAPLLLSPPTNLARPQERTVAARDPARALLLGGPAALAAAVESNLRRAHLGEPGGPWERDVQPPAGTTVSVLPDVTVTFDRPLEASSRSSVHVTVDGAEILGSVQHGDGRLVFRTSDLPIALESGRTYEVRVVTAAYDGSSWRHLDHTLTLRGPSRSPPGLVDTLPEDGASGVWPGERAVALTFDDGPSPAYTPQILDVLDRYGAAATFFVTGAQLDRFPLLVRETAARGHVVSNHTVSHRALPGLSASTFAAEVDGATSRIVRATGQAVHCVRPPYGAYDGEVVSRLTGRGLHTAMWTIDPRDWARPGADAIARRTLDGLHPGAVVVLHDGGGDRSQTVAALPRLLEGIRGAGYRVATLCG